ncbi:MAG: SDR family oxidoreductase [Bacteroidota bacterium]
MELGIKNKVFIITGGAEGIGRAIAKAIVSEGGISFIAGLAREAGESLIQEIRERRGAAHFKFQRLGSAESCKEIVEDCIKTYGRIDGLVNNAGGNDGISLEQGSPDAWIRSLENNLHHYYYMAHYCLDELKKNKGVILNLSSKTAFTGQGGTSPYAAAKGAQLALTREWAVELLKYGIRVNSIVPAEVMTAMYKRWIESFDEPDRKIAEIESRIPLENRMTKAEEIADTALFLLSSRSSHITGQHIFVDGGYAHLDRALSVLKDQ